MAYQRADHATISHYLTGSNDGKAYIELQDGSLYVLTETDFTPALSPETLLSRINTLVYDPKETYDVNVHATNNTTQLDGTGVAVVQLISYGPDGSTKTFSTDEYTKNPQGFYRNNWAIGVGFMLAGIALGTFLFFFARYRKQKNPGLAAPQGGFTVSPSAALAANSGQPSVPPSFPAPQQAPYVQPNPYQVEQVPFPQQSFQQYPEADPGSAIGYQPTRYSTPPGKGPADPV